MQTGFIEKDLAYDLPATSVEDHKNITVRSITVSLWHGSVQSDTLVAILIRVTIGAIQ